MLTEKPIIEREKPPKRLRFADPLPELVLSGEKNATWRIDDDKNLQIGDILSLQRMDDTEFGRAEVTGIKDTKFGELTEEDKIGHEKFLSDDDMLRTYSDYYNMAVFLDTSLKIVRFELK